MLIKLGVVVALGVACAIIVPVTIQRVRDRTAGVKSSSSESVWLNSTERKIVGSWRWSISEADIPGVKTEIWTFNDDRTFNWVARERTTVRGEAKGEWRIEDDTLILRIMSATGDENDEEIRLFKARHKVATGWAMTITSVSEKKFALRAKDGKNILILTRL